MAQRGTMTQGHTASMPQSLDSSPGLSDSTSDVFFSTMASRSFEAPSECLAKRTIIPWRVRVPVSARPSWNSWQVTAERVKPLSPLPPSPESQFSLTQPLCSVWYQVSRNSTDWCQVLMTLRDIMQPWLHAFPSVMHNKGYLKSHTGTCRPSSPLPEPLPCSLAQLRSMTLGMKEIALDLGQGVPKFRSGFCCLLCDLREG